MEHIQPISASLAEAVPFVLIAGIVCTIWLCACRRLRPGEAGTLLFLKSTALLATVGIVYVGAAFFGVVPASHSEREFIALVRNSDLSKEPAVLASLKIVDTGLYVSKNDFRLVAESVK